MVMTVGAGMAIGAGIGAVGGIASSYISGQQAGKNQNKQRRYEKKVYKKRIKWTVDAAKKAGIHPLAALGVQGPQTSAMHVGQNDYGIGKASEHIARGVQNYAVHNDQKALNQLQTTNFELQNDKLAIENAIMYKELYPSPDQDLMTGQVRVTPPEQLTKIKEGGGFGSGSHATAMWSGMPDDYHTMMPNEKTAEIFESYFPGAAQFFGSVFKVRGQVKMIHSGFSENKNFQQLWKKILPAPPKGQHWRTTSTGNIKAYPGKPQFWENPPRRSKPTPNYDRYKNRSKIFKPKKRYN